MPVYYAVKEYGGKSNLEIYQKHYIFWQAWHGELIDRWGKSTKRMVSSADGAFRSLKRMQTLLSREKAEALNEYIDRLESVESLLGGPYMEGAQSIKLKRDLERDLRAIKRQFYYKHVFDDILKTGEKAA